MNLDAPHRCAEHGGPFSARCIKQGGSKKAGVDMYRASTLVDASIHIRYAFRGPRSRKSDQFTSRWTPFQILARLMLSSTANVADQERFMAKKDVGVRVAIQSLGPPMVETAIGAAQVVQSHGDLRRD